MEEGFTACGGGCIEHTGGQGGALEVGRLEAHAASGSEFGVWGAGVVGALSLHRQRLGLGHL